MGSRIAWETGILKPTDNVIFWMTASYQAVAKANVRWPRNELDRRPSLQSKGEGSRAHRETTVAMSPSGGVVSEGMVTRMC